MLYALVTVYTVVSTANHYFLDAVGGLVAFGIGALLARLVRTGRRRWLATG
ncbi:MAG: phosphatase PAP2 family protein [Ilumatobacteraceae bacterium]